MEKYRQFEDPSNGINPFIEIPLKDNTFSKKIIYMLTFILGIIRFTCFIPIYYLFAVLQALRHVFLISSLKRKIEVFNSSVFSTLLLYLLGVFSYPYKYKKQDSKRVPNIIFSSQSSVIDWLVLIHNYSPRFLWIAKSENNESDYFIELSYFDVISYSIGLKFPTSNEKEKKFEVSKYIDSPNQIPLVIFPENTKTNRQAVLNIRSNLFDDIYSLMQQHEKILLRSEIIIKPTNLNNTTDRNGYKKLLQSCNQITTSIQIYSQDISNDTFVVNTQYDKIKFSSLSSYLDSNLQEHLMEYTNRNTVCLNSKKHSAFLNYFENTQTSEVYIKKED